MPTMNEDDVSRIYQKLCLIFHCYVSWICLVGDCLRIVPWDSSPSKYHWVIGDNISCFVQLPWANPSLSNTTPLSTEPFSLRIPINYLHSQKLAGGYPKWWFFEMSCWFLNMAMFGIHVGFLGVVYLGIPSNPPTFLRNKNTVTASGRSETLKTSGFGTTWAYLSARF